MIVLTADVGSTFTKLTAIDTDAVKVLGTAKSFTTIDTDVMEGFCAAKKQLFSLIGEVKADKVLAASSAAGGLKMVSVGLVPSLSSGAARMAAEGAGAKLMRAYSYELSSAEAREISAINPDLILLSGGIDGGNKDIIIKNAETIGGIKGNFSVIVAGNKSAADEIEDIFSRTKTPYVISANVLPSLGNLSVAPAQNAIRELFIKRIIEAKGLNKLQEICEKKILPTPLAVYNALALFSKGTENAPGLGDIMAFDIGGATTDVYSCAHGLPSSPGVTLKGLKEPQYKRTVEADIGMRYSLEHLLELAGVSQIAAQSGETEDNVTAFYNKCLERKDTVPKSDGEKRIDCAFARCAVKLSSGRHCGNLERLFTPMGESYVQTGKDLTGARYVIGSGGVITYSPDPKNILSGCLYSVDEPMTLRPKDAKFLLDKKSILAAMGLLGEIMPGTAMEIMGAEITEI